VDLFFGKIINICVLINLVLYLPCNFKTNIIVAKGFIQETASEELIGGLMTLIGVIWSIVDKNKTV
jgi:hypothetical protein